MIYFPVRNNVKVVIRTCMDKDLNSQCGLLDFNNEKIRGCMYTCKNSMCNESGPLIDIQISFVILLLILNIIL